MDLVTAWWWEGAAIVVGLGLWAVQFGWVSRRIERQADTFAARHMQSTMVREMNADDDQRFGDRGVYCMILALQRVADLNHISPTRRSWRHGSIAWRQQYLRGLIGRPLDAAPVDLQMRQVKLASVLMLLAAVGVYFFLRP